MWSHSYKSFTLMDNPVARLDITPTFHGFDADEIECEIPKLKIIAKKNRLYQMNLFKKDGDPFHYQDYSNIRQLGRHFAITVND